MARIQASPTGATVLIGLPTDGSWAGGLGSITAGMSISDALDALDEAAGLLSTSYLAHTHDHGTLTGLGDDDHSIYLLADATRAVTGQLPFTDAFGSYTVGADGFGDFVVKKSGTSRFGLSSGVTTIYNAPIEVSHRIYNYGAALNLGTSAASSHSLTIGDVVVGGALEVDGVIWGDTYYRASANGSAGATIYGNADGTMGMYFGANSMGIALFGLAKWSLAGSGINQTNTTFDGTIASDPSSFLASSGVEKSMAMQQQIAQSGTAGYTFLEMAVSHNAIGSGAKKFIDAKLGGLSYFALMSDGRLINEQAVMQLGTAASTSHSLVTGDVIVGGALEVDGIIWGDAGEIHSGTVAFASVVDDVVALDSNGLVGGQRTTDVAPQGLLIRPQNAFPGGTQTSANLVLAGGQDETKIDIDDYTQGVNGDTVTVRVIDSNGTLTSTVLTVITSGIPTSTQWLCATSNAATATSLATAVNQIAGITAVASSAQVRISLKPNTARVNLAESRAALTTVATGTAGKVIIPADSGATTIAGGFLYATNMGSSQMTGLLFGNNQLSAVNAALGVATIHAGTRCTVGTSTGNGSGALDTTDGLFYGSLAAGFWPVSTAGLSNTSIQYIRTGWVKGIWTNATVTALGAVTSGEVTIFTSRAKTRVLAAIIEITGTAAGVTTLTVSCGKTGATYDDYVKAGDAKVAANTLYGDAKDGSETGTNLFDATGKFCADITSWTATTAIKLQFVSTGANLSAITGCTGNVYLLCEVLP